MGTTPTTSAANVTVDTEMVDNPGGGDCAFYAFAIGLVDIIQDEAIANQTSMFSRWLALDPQIETLYLELIECDVTKADPALLLQLQRSLRKISYERTLNDLRSACVLPDEHYTDLTADYIFNQFMALYHQNDGADPRYNLLANANGMRAAMAKIRNDFPTLDDTKVVKCIAPEFLRILYGSDVDVNAITPDTPIDPQSPILLGIQNLTKDGYWGTHTDLNNLAGSFKVNLHTLTNQVANYTPADNADQHTVTLNNKDNTHWVTRLTLAKVNGSVKTPTAVTVPVASASSAPRNASADKLSTFLSSEQLEKIKAEVARITKEYTQYNSSVWYSIFHRHGAAGRVRAQEFAAKFAQSNDICIALLVLKDFLKDDENGNTHPHSYRTMLLQVLADKKLTLQEVSQNFQQVLTKESCLKNAGSMDVTLPEGLRI